MRVAITGATGLIGRHLTRALLDRGDEVVPLSRANGDVHGVSTLAWDPVFDDLPAAAMDGVGAIVNLAGASVAEGRWGREQKKLIRDSRVITTTRIADALAGAGGGGPAVLVSGSATGYYGNRDDELLPESAGPGQGFLSEVAVAWEAAAMAAARGGVRVAISRTGMVFAEDGGVIPRLAKLTRAGMAGPLAGGRQWVPWVDIADVVGMIVAAIDDDAWEGPFNNVAPEPMRQAEVAKAFGRAVGRPAVVPTPALALKMTLGDAAVLVTDSHRTDPVAARDHGYGWAYGDIDASLGARIT
ncbi:MAG: TIGR01777 family oxidoreductase [Acidobacteria bacterium]|nr:TIGR01777 family oxidoreductase [Acidobacteriota bacterium]